MKNNRLHNPTKKIIRFLNPGAGLVLLVLLVSILSSCSTKKNSFTRRVYHNLTAHYNAYWNGNESFEEGVRTIEEDVKDNYTTVLPVFKYGSEQDAQSIYPNMDRAIEKASKVIQRHSMYFKRKEWVRWIDDSYMLIGKAYFYKKEFSSARRTFEFITNRFSKEDSRFEAELWLARTYNQSGEFEKAESVLDNLNSSIRNGEAPSDIEKDFTRIYANFHILQQEYAEAIEYLQRAIELNRRKKDLNRLRFILAQIYQELGDLQAAAKLYNQVIRKNPPYEMAFNARINLAKTYDAKSSNRSAIVKELNKMLKDSKNEEYRDQIYFALAEIYLKDKQEDQSIEYLTLSVASSMDNDFQKSISSLRLADIYFTHSDYSRAQAYYDTAMQFLPPEFPNYEELTKKTSVLTELITNLQTIQVQDSLQSLAQMPETERNAIIDELIKKIAEEEARLAEEERERQRTLSMLEQTNRQQNRDIQQSGGWYFYNPSAVSFGYTEFQKKWGRRKLEDLWRLSNKQIIPEFGDEVEDELAAADSLGSDSTAVVVTDPKKREFYLQYLPLTEEKMA
ncbi:MAG: tetratricopeptide repeat protein, partial [Bacteroidales bacterium]